MANVRMTADATHRRGRVDEARVDATSEEDVRRQAREEGFDPDQPFEGLVPMISPATIRARLGFSQARFAKALRLPLATLRNWEQGRTQPDPAALSLLALVNDDPERALRVLANA